MKLNNKLKPNFCPACGRDNILTDEPFGKAMYVFCEDCKFKSTVSIIGRANETELEEQRRNYQRQYEKRRDKPWNLK